MIALLIVGPTVAYLLGAAVSAAYLVERKGFETDDATGASLAWIVVIPYMLTMGATRSLLMPKEDRPQLPEARAR